MQGHGHDFDEYWWFTSGSPQVTLWTPGTGARNYALHAGDLVVLVRGMQFVLGPSPFVDVPDRPEAVTDAPRTCFSLCIIDSPRDSTYV